MIFNNLISNQQVFQFYVKLFDSLRKPIHNNYHLDWNNTNDVNDAIQLIQEDLFKQYQGSSIFSMEIDNKKIEGENLFINFPKNV